MASTLYQLGTPYPPRHCERLAWQSTFGLKRKEVWKKNPSSFFVAKMDCHAIARNDGVLGTNDTKINAGGIQ
jgi:hypothetical protein